MKRVAKTVLLGVIAIMSLGVLTACIDYSYEYHFTVVGGNGIVTLSTDLEREKISPIRLMGGKSGSHNLKFIATPNEGYQVKEWIYNGEIVVGNKSNFLVTSTVNYENNIIIITVEFEPIP